MPGTQEEIDHEICNPVILFIINIKFSTVWKLLNEIQN